jgi:hypothetical protein
VPAENRHPALSAAITPAYGFNLLDLARKRLEGVERAADEGQLDAVLRRLFDPDQREHLTVSAFSSAL